MLPTKHHSATIPKKAKRRTKTILDQKEHFKLKPQQCFHGNETYEMHYNDKAVLWQKAIQCLEALNIDMSVHKNTGDSQPVRQMGDDEYGYQG